MGQVKGFVLLAAATAALSILCAYAPDAYAKSKDPCVECHADTTPGIVDYWKASAHHAADVQCAGCHGTDVEANHGRQLTVGAEVCGKCHKKALDTHKQGKHDISLKAGRGCTRHMPPSAKRDKTCSLCHEAGSTKPKVIAECAMFLAQSPEMQRQGYGSCHRVETACDSCHTRHGTDFTVTHGSM